MAITALSDSLAEQIDEARRRAQALASGLMPEQLMRRPEPGKWSIAECLAHLTTTAAIVQPLMVKAIEGGKQEKKFRNGPFSIGPKGRLLVWIAEPPPKFKLRAPKDLRPPEIADPAQLLPAFLRAQDEWERLMREQEGLDLAKIKAGQGIFRIRLAAVLPWMMAHQRRHLAQAEKVKAAIRK